MFPCELTALWLLMKGRRPGARVLIAPTWSGGRGGKLALQLQAYGGGGRCRERSGRKARRAQAAEQRGCGSLVPHRGPRSIPHCPIHVDGALPENSKGREALGNSPELFQGKKNMSLGALSRAFIFLTSSKKRHGGPEPGRPPLRTGGSRPRVRKASPVA